MTTSPKPRRVVVTGLSGICNVGHGREAIWNALLEGRPNMNPIPQYQGPEWPVKFGGIVTDWSGKDRIEHGTLKRLDRFAALGLFAAVEAVEDCGIDFSKEDPWMCGVVVGSGVGGVHTIEEYIEKMREKGPDRVTPFLVPRLMVNAASGNISIRWGLRGPNSAPATACASGGNAIGDAFQLIQDGDADVMLTGGAETAMTPLCMAGFSVMKALSTRNDDMNRASRPFDKDRDGFVLAEGAGIIVIEELEHAKRRGANIYCELLGYGSTGDASHITAPDPDGAGAAHCMELALKDAGINADQVDHINAHGTSTPLGDLAEAKAIRRVFGDHTDTIAVTSTKSVTGHTLGASGGIEAMAVALAIRNGVIPPTANFDTPDPECRINVVGNTAREQDIKYAISNSFGFGGHNVSLVFGKYTG